MSTIHELRLNLEQAQASYLSANIEHPTALITAKDELTNARLEYWSACADLVMRIPQMIVCDCGCTVGNAPNLVATYTDITGEPL